MPPLDIPTVRRELLHLDLAIYAPLKGALAEFVHFYGIDMEAQVRFSDACGAEIPRWIRKQMSSYGDDQISIQKFGEDVITGMCEQLLAGGAPGLHFYTMNQTEPTMALWRRLGLPGT